MRKRERRKRGSLDLADLYDRLGMPRLAERSRNCGRGFARQTCRGCGRVRIDARGVFSCWSRFCPSCSSRRSAAVAGRLEKGLDAFLAERPSHRYFLTLTFADHPRLLNFGRDYVARVKALFRHPFWKQYGLVGGIRAFEVKIGSGSGEWHPHFHILLMTERPIPLIESGEHRGRWQNAVNQRVSDIWGQVTGGSYILQGEAIREGHMGELLKYICKSLTELEDDKAKELILWAKGKRFMSAFGKLYNSPTVRAAVTADDEEKGLHVCECGCDTFQVEHFRWSDRLGNYILDDVFDVRIREVEINIGESPPGEVT